MSRRLADLDYHVLELLEGNPAGVGSGSLLLHLQDLGMDVSQPTIGRMLKLLDHRGLTRKVANKGRVPTSAGLVWLAHARHRRQRARWVERLIGSAQPATLGELRDMLVARRTLEQEIARLAAERATATQVAEMRQTVEAQRTEVESAGTGNGPALDFHRLLAASCGNPFLALASEVLRTERQALEVIMYHLGSTVGGESYSSHAQILEAVAAHDGRGARRAMLRHINQFIRYVDSLSKRPQNIDLRSGNSPSPTATSCEWTDRDTAKTRVALDQLRKGGIFHSFK